MTATSADSTNELLIPEGDLQRLLICQHHAPHDFYGWHPLPSGGSVIRTRQLGAVNVEILIHNESCPMEHIGDDIWAIRLKDKLAPDY
ncbi:1,4-alpha-glucan branching enzyme, partial [Acinetobacter baumannii]|nr:1,4-alpha-glucan branching enzyme [Acinetobacter baumannii]